MLPLGERWAGLCHVDGALPTQPQDAMYCNLGYARGRCSRFPDDAGADAVRFTITQDDAAGVKLYYVMERDHHPFAHGPLDYFFAAGFGAAAGDLLERQATAYVETFRRRKGAL